MCNTTKDKLEIPETLQTVNIAMTPKQGKKSSTDISNQQGIFILSICRSILMRLLLKDEYKMIDEFMSGSNVGGRKGKRIQDHLFIINGIIFDHARSKSKSQLTIAI